MYRAGWAVEQERTHQQGQNGPHGAPGLRRPGSWRVPSRLTLHPCLQEPVRWKYSGCLPESTVDGGFRIAYPQASLWPRHATAALFDSCVSLGSLAGRHAAALWAPGTGTVGFIDFLGLFDEGLADGTWFRCLPPGTPSNPSRCPTRGRPARQEEVWVRSAARHRLNNHRHGRSWCRGSRIHRANASIPRRRCTGLPRASPFGRTTSGRWVRLSRMLRSNRSAARDGPRSARQGAHIDGFQAEPLVLAPTRGAPREDRGAQQVLPPDHRHWSSGWNSTRGRARVLARYGAHESRPELFVWLYLALLHRDGDLECALPGGAGC